MVYVLFLFLTRFDENAARSNGHPTALSLHLYEVFLVLAKTSLI